jgi:hypothetical protein
MATDPRLPGIAQAAALEELPTSAEQERAGVPFTGESVRGELHALLAQTKVPPPDVSAAKGAAGAGKPVDRCEFLKGHVEPFVPALRAKGTSLLSERRGQLESHKARRRAEVRAQMNAKSERARSASTGARAEVQAEAGVKQQQAQNESEARRTAAMTEHDAKVREAQTKADGDASAIADETKSAVEAKTAEAQGQADEQIAEGRRQAAEAEAQAQAHSRSTTGIGVLDSAIDSARNFAQNLLSRARSFVSNAMASARRIIAGAKTWIQQKYEAARNALARLRDRLANALRSAASWIGRKLRDLGAWFMRTVRAIGAWLKKAFFAILRFLHSVLAWIVMALASLFVLMGIGFLAIAWVLSWLLGDWGKGIRAWLEKQIEDLRGLFDRMINLLGDPFTKNFDECDQDKIDKLKPSVPRAASRASRAAGTLTGAATLAPNVQAVFTREFVRGGGTITDPMVARVRNVLAATAAGLNSDPVDFRCDSASEASCGGRVVAYTFHAKLAPFISIHVCPGAFTSGGGGSFDVADLEDTVLHEGTHKYGSTDDNAYSDGDRAGLSSEGALNNAASHEKFARGVAG